MLTFNNDLLNSANWLLIRDNFRVGLLNLSLELSERDNHTHICVFWPVSNFPYVARSICCRYLSELLARASVVEYLFAHFSVSRGNTPTEVVAVGCWL